VPEYTEKIAFKISILWWKKSSRFFESWYTQSDLLCYGTIKNWVLQLLAAITTQ